MNEKLLEEALEAVYKAEFAEFDNAPDHIFSLRHRIRMRRVFAIYEKNTNKRKVKFSRKMVLALIIIILLAVISGCTAVIISRFKNTVYEDNTLLQAEDFTMGKEFIEELYYFPVIPDGYEYDSELTAEMCAGKMHVISYSDEVRLLVLTQSTHDIYETHYNTEYNDFEDIVIKSHTGLYLVSPNGNVGTVVWDNGDYIFEIEATLTKEELIRLAESLEYEVIK